MIFERYVIGQRRPIGGKTILIAASIVLHALAGVTLVVWSFVHVERIEPPPLTVTFFSAAAPPPPPPPPPPPAGKKSPTPKVKPPLVQPKSDEKPLTQPTEPEPDEPDDDDGASDDTGGVTGGVTGGTAGGTVGGTVGGVLGSTGDPAPVAPPPAPVKPKNVAPHQLDNEALFHPLPHLPEVVKAQRRGMGLALFVAKICIAQNGAVQSVTVIQGIPGADEIIAATIRQWRYKPQAIPVCFVNNFEFDVQ